MNKKLVIATCCSAILLSVYSCKSSNKNSTSENGKKTASSEAVQPKLELPNGACEVLTPEAAKLVLGDAISEPKQTTYSSNQNISLTTCSYTAREKDSVSIVLRKFAEAAPAAATPPVVEADTTASKNVEKTEATTEAQKYATSLKALVTDPNAVETIDGIGDGAVWEQASNQLTVFVGKDSYALSSLIEGKDAKDIKQSLLAVANKVFTAK